MEFPPDLKRISFGVGLIRARFLQREYTGAAIEGQDDLGTAAGDYPVIENSTYTARRRIALWIDNYRVK